MAVKNRRTGGGRGGAHSPRGRRAPPPASTGKEQLYIKALKEARTAIVAELTDGRSVHGVIEYYDRDMIKITRLQGPHFFVRKSDIRYIRELTED